MFNLVVQGICFLFHYQVLTVIYFNKINVVANFKLLFTVTQCFYIFNDTDLLFK